MNNSDKGSGNTLQSSSQRYRATIKSTTVSGLYYSHNNKTKGKWCFSFWKHHTRNDMSNYYDEIVSILKKDDRFFSKEGSLLKNALYEAAMKMDVKLIKLLYSNELTKKQFFRDVEGIAVFDKVGFGWLVNNRSFFPDSYTRYKNKIGLTDEFGNLISNSNQVELVFPYKDCILAGGQTKEDQKRQEVFYNVSLAPDEVDRLMYPKVLTGFKRVSAQGISEADSLSIDDNYVIKGNNLLALSSIEKRFANRVRMVYWDVPYNTGSDSFGYNDKFSRSSWLLFIKNRVEKVLPMLTNHGGVFLIQCSFHQYSYLKVLLDEIIGNYVMTFNVLVRHPERTLTGDKEFNDVIEYILVYSKSSNFKMPKKEEGKTVDDYQWVVKELTSGKSITFEGRKARVFLPDEYEMTRIEPARENFKIVTVRGSIKEKNSSGRFYVKHLHPLEKKYPPKTLFKVEDIGDDMYDYRYFYLPPEGNKNGAYLQGMPTSSDVTYKPYPNFLDFVQSYNVVNDEGNVEFRNGKKPEDLLAFLIGIFTAEGDLVLDAFGGSGTTAAVALKMNRQFIICEQMDYVEDVTVKRIMGVLNGEESDLLPEYEYDGHGSFVYFELAKLNQLYVDRIYNAKERELKKIWADIMETGYISCKVTPAEIDLSSDDFISLTEEEKKRLLLCLLDMNQLYVNYCDIDDKSFKISKYDKHMTKMFYGEE